MLEVNIELYEKDEKLAEEVRKMLVQKGYGNIVWK